MTLLELVEKIANEVKKSTHVHAMWLEGSYATGTFNDQSDIDVWLDVDDGTFDTCYKEFRKQLEKVIGIRSWESHELYSEKPRLSKYKFYLEGFSDDQRIELDLQEHSREFVFSKSDHTPKVLFDKDGTIQWKDNLG